MSKPDQSVVAPHLDAIDDHLHQVLSAHMQLARSASRMVNEFKTWQAALRVVESHTEYAVAANDNVRALRPTIRGRRRDLVAGEAA